MELEKIEKIIKDSLKDYPEILNRKQISKIVGIDYRRVPEFLQTEKIPFLGISVEGKENSRGYISLKLHKGILQGYLIKKYTRG